MIELAGGQKFSCSYASVCGISTQKILNFNKETPICKLPRAIKKTSLSAAYKQPPFFAIHQAFALSTGILPSGCSRGVRGLISENVGKIGAGQSCFALHKHEVPLARFALVCSSMGRVLLLVFCSKFSYCSWSSTQLSKKWVSLLMSWCFLGLPPDARLLCLSQLPSIVRFNLLVSSSSSFCSVGRVQRRTPADRKFS